MRHLEAEFRKHADALSASFEGPVGLAVSGGGDSLALLYLAAGWAEDTGRSLLALTVDHGLRAEARAEAETVAVHCAGLGVAHRILTWQPPQGHIGQERSRRARHGLLAEALRVAGGALLFLAHTEDDQLETVGMRAAREEPQTRPGHHSGLAGMRALAVSPVWPEGRGVYLGRPLLAATGQDLRAYLKERGRSWSEDPSNQNSAYERVRVRRALKANGGQQAALRCELAGVHMDAQAIRRQQDQALGIWLRDHVQAFADGSLRFEGAAVTGGELDQQTLAEGLAWLLMIAAGQDRRASRESRLRLAGDILDAPFAFRARTLGGAWIAPRQKQIMIARDPGRAAPLPSRPEAGLIWDGRFLCLKADHMQNLAENALDPRVLTEFERMSAMSRETYPELAAYKLIPACLGPERLNQVQFMLNYDNLTK